MFSDAVAQRRLARRDGGGLVTYPQTLSETDTLDLVLAGQSLARYGDGEFNLCAGRPAKAQRIDVRIQSRLQMGLCSADYNCLIAVPNLQSKTPKAEFWNKQINTALRFMEPGRTYGSAFVTRPDSAPWIDTPEYWAKLESLWVGEDVTLVTGGRHGLKEADLVGANVREVIAPSANAFSDYHALLELVGTPRRALICLGPTATVLAIDLCRRGVHAIDLGHVGLFLRKHRAGLPMTVTDEDKAA